MRRQLTAATPGQAYSTPPQTLAYLQSLRANYSEHQPRVTAEQLIICSQEYEVMDLHVSDEYMQPSGDTAQDIARVSMDCPETLLVSRFESDWQGAFVACYQAGACVYSDFCTEGNYDILKRVLSGNEPFVPQQD